MGHSTRTVSVEALLPSVDVLTYTVNYCAYVINSLQM